MTGGILVKSQNPCIMQLSNIITWVMFNLKQSLGLPYTVYCMPRTVCQEPSYLNPIQAIWFPNN